MDFWRRDACSLCEAIAQAPVAHECVWCGPAGGLRAVRGDANMPSSASGYLTPAGQVCPACRQRDPAKSRGAAAQHEVDHAEAQALADEIRATTIDVWALR